MRRVVVTGLGMVSPLACGVDETWNRLLAGESGGGTITRFDASDLPCQIACEIPRGDGTNGTFNPEQWMEAKEIRRYDDFIIYAMAAAKQAVRDSGVELNTEDEKYRAGVLIGSGIGGLSNIADTTTLMNEKGPRRAGGDGYRHGDVRVAGQQAAGQGGLAGSRGRRHDEQQAAAGNVGHVWCFTRCSGPARAAGR